MKWVHDMISLLPSYQTVFVSIILILFICIIVFVLIIHIWFPFWAKQPMLHSYDFIRRLTLVRPLVIQPDSDSLKKSILKNYWFRPLVIKTQLVADVSDTVKQQIVYSLQGNYSKDEVLWSMPYAEWCQRYTGSSYVSMYSNNNGFMLSRPYHMVLWNMSTPVYYLDEIVVTDSNTDMRQALFQTHVFRQRVRSKTPVSIFRTMGQPLAGLTPLTQIKVVETMVQTYKTPMQLPIPYLLRYIEDYDTIQEMVTGGHDWILIPPKELFHGFKVMGIYKADECLALYIWWRSWCLDAETGMDRLELAGSYYVPNLPVGIFQMGFQIGIQDISKTVPINRLCIPYRGMNERVMGDGELPILGETMEYWYLHNMMSPMVSSDRCFLII